MGGYIVKNGGLIPMAVTTTSPEEHTADLLKLADCSLKVMPNLDGYKPNNKRAQILADPVLRAAYFKNWLNVYAMSVGEPQAGDICLDPVAITELVNQSVGAFEAYYAMSAVHQERSDKAAMAALKLINNATVLPRWSSIMQSTEVKTALNAHPVARKIVLNHPIAVAAMMCTMSASSFINPDGSFDQINTSCTVSYDSGFYNSKSLKTCAPINFTNAVTINNLFYGCTGLVECPELLNMGNVATAASMFANCSNLQSIVLPDLTTCDSLARLGSNCTSLKSVVLTDVGNVTDAADIFTGSPNLETIVLHGLSKSNLSVANTKLNADALNALFNSLGTSNGQTVTITNCPGAATCVRSIATSKGWVVTG